MEIRGECLIAECCRKAPWASYQTAIPINIFRSHGRTPFVPMQKRTKDSQDCMSYCLNKLSQEPAACRLRCTLHVSLWQYLSQTCQIRCICRMILTNFCSMLSRARARKNQMTTASVKNNRERFRPENTQHKNQG